MSFTLLFILIPTLCYAGAAVAYAVQGTWPLAVTYAGYAFANLGLIALDLQGGKL